MVYAEIGGSRSGFATIGAVSAQVIPFNGNRKEAVIVNTSVNDVSFHKGDSPAVLNSGITLRSGGVMIIEPDSMGRIWKGAIQAISGGAGRNISWTEDW